MNKQSKIDELIKKCEQLKIDAIKKIDKLPKPAILLETTILPQDILNLCDSYLSCNERIYIRNIWTEFPKDKICNIAAENGWLDLLKWAINSNICMQGDVYAFAALNGHMEIIKWVRKNCPNTLWHINTCAYAARGGHLEIIKWAVGNGCEVASDTSLCAAEEGHLDIIIWLRNNGYELNQRIYHRAVGRGQNEVVDWLENNFSRYCHVAKLAQYAGRCPEYVPLI